MAELWGIITSGERVTADRLEFDYGDGQGYRKATKNPMWFQNYAYRKLKGRVLTTDRNVSVAIYINGFLSNSRLSGGNWLIDIDEESGMVNFEWVGTDGLFDEEFLLQINII